MKRLKAVVIPQPFATLAAFGVHSILVARWGVVPGKVAIYADSAWDDTLYNSALEMRVTLKGLGVKSRRLMPLGCIVAVAEIEACDQIGDPHEYARLNWLDRGFDSEIKLVREHWCYHVSDVTPVDPPYYMKLSKPVTLLDPKDERQILSRCGEKISPWGSIVR